MTCRHLAMTSTYLPLFTCFVIMLPFRVVLLLAPTAGTVDQSEINKPSAKSIQSQQTFDTTKTSSSPASAATGAEGLPGLASRAAGQHRQRNVQRTSKLTAAGAAEGGGGSGEKRYNGDSANVSRLLDSILTGYDKRLRPNYNGNPVEVGVTMHVSSVSAISEVNMDYTLDFYFRQHWHDPRLNFTDIEDDELCISNEMLARIWWPDTFFANAKMANFHLATTHNAFLRIKPNGWVTLSLSDNKCAAQPRCLQIFEELHQNNAYSVKHIDYEWKDGPQKSVGLSQGVQLLPQFSVRGYRALKKLETLSTGNYSRLACEFYFVRSLGYYLIHIYIPSCLIVVLSWVSFWLHRDASPARVGLGITTVLTMTTVLSSSNASLPKISYLKSIDFYLVTCFFMVFSSLLEYASVSYISNLSRSVATSDASSGSSGGYTVRRHSKPLPAELTMETGQQRACAMHGHHRKSKKPSETVVTEVCLRSAGSRLGSGTFDCKVKSAQTTPPAGSFMPSPPSLNTSSSAVLMPTSSSTGRQRIGGHRKASLSAATPLTQTAVSVEESLSDKVKVDRLVALACRIDRYSRGVFPLVFAAFNIAYWVIFVNISPKPRETDFVFIE